MAGRLSNKVALVTGAARGIGEAVARAFVGEGAFVFLSDITDDEGQALSAEIGKGCVYRHLDVRNEGDWQEVTAEILRDKGGLDIVVNNAGITGFDGSSRRLRNSRGPRARGLGARC